MKWVLLSPLFAGIALALILYLGGRRWPRWLRAGGWALLLACYLLMTPLVAEPLIGLIEARAAAPCKFTPEAIVVLAGGADLEPDQADFAALNLASLRRVIGAAALWHRQPPGTPLVLAGGSGRQGLAESPRMAALAERLGVPPARIRTETRSTTTWENAREVARLAPPVPRRVWLVTSAVHMPRATYTMRRFGFSVCPVPVDYRRQPLMWSTAVMPSGDALHKSDAALHEIAGLLWYRLKR